MANPKTKPTASNHPTATPTVGVRGEHATANGKISSRADACDPHRTGWPLRTLLYHTSQPKDKPKGTLTGIVFRGALTGAKSTPQPQESAPAANRQLPHGLPWT
jgi:hypothetical protein